MAASRSELTVALRNGCLDEAITIWNAVDAMAKSLLAHPDLERSTRSALCTGGIGATGGGGHGLFEEVVARIGMREVYQAGHGLDAGLDAKIERLLEVVEKDAAGHTFFKGRLRETLRISHHMVAPGEIEAFLMSHPAVEQAFVVGVPDPETNEAPVAYVILRPGAGLAEDVPRTPGPHGDEVQKGKLRDQALTELGIVRS